MKTKTSIILIALFIAMFSLQAQSETIRGNKNIVTKTISITDYDEVSLAGSMTFEYEQSDKAPYFEITVDENVLPYVNVEVRGKELVVGPKRRENGWGNNSYNLNPTVYKIKSNSKGLDKISLAGSGAFIANSPLQTASSFTIEMAGSGRVDLTKAVTAKYIKGNMAGSGSINTNDLSIDEMEFNMAGSGKIILNKQQKGSKIKLNVAGSGKLIANDVQVQKAECNLSASGELSVSGTTKETSYSLAGSGKIKAFDCKADKVNASVSGSGRIELYANENLNASVMGSGSINYKGSPSVQSTKSGSGSVRAAN